MLNTLKRGEFQLEPHPGLKQKILDKKWNDLSDDGKLNYNDTGIPVPIRGIYTALNSDSKIETFQRLLVFQVTSGTEVFQRIPIPRKFFKDENVS